MDFKIFWICFDDESIEEIERQLPKLIEERNSDQLFQWLQNLHYDEIGPLIPDLEIRRLIQNKKTQIKQWLLLENFYLAIKFWPNQTSSTLDKDLQFNDDVMYPILIGLEELGEKYFHKAQYLAFLKSVEVKIKSLLSADHQNYMNVFSIAWRLLQVLPNQIERVRREVEDPTLPLGIGKIKIDLPVVHFGLILRLLLERGVIPKGITQERLVQFAHEHFILKNGQPPGLMSLKQCLTIKESETGEIKLFFNNGRKSLAALRDVDPTKSRYFPK